MYTVLFGYVIWHVNDIRHFGTVDRIPKHGIVHVTKDLIMSNNATNSTKNTSIITNIITNNTANFTNSTCNIPWRQDQYYFITGSAYEFLNQPGNPCTPNCKNGVYLCNAENRWIKGADEFLRGDYSTKPPQWTEHPII